MDEDRAVYAAWGLGAGSAWYVLNPTTQVAGWKEAKAGWLGASVAAAMTRTGTAGAGRSALDDAVEERREGKGRRGGVVPEGGPTTAMGNKWQQAGAWAVDGRGVVVWGGKAVRADDVLDLEAGVRALVL